MILAAVSLGKAEILDYLLEHGANADIHGGWHTPIEFVNYLKLKGKWEGAGNPMDDELENYFETTSGSFCSCHEKMTFFIPEKEGEALIAGSPLHFAVERGNMEIIKLLVNKGDANIHAKSTVGETPFYLAVLNNQIYAMEYLHGLGADINAADKIGRSPLYMASLFGFEQIVEYLLKHNADGKSHENQFGFTPLHAAEHEGHDKVSKMLLDSGLVDKNALDKEGKTAEELRL